MQRVARRMVGRIRTLRAGHNSTTSRRNVHSGDRLVVTLQLILELEIASRPLVELDIVVTGDSQSLLVSREGVVRNGCVEEVVDFWCRHCRVMTGMGFEICRFETQAKEELSTIAWPCRVPS